MGRKPSPDGPSKVLSVRMTQDFHRWYDSLGDAGPELVKAKLEELRLGGSTKAIDSKLARLKDDLTELEEEALQVKKEIRELEGIKATLMEAQMGSMRVRQDLLERYARQPEHFMGWLTGPANQHLITDGKFETAQDVVTFCRGELAKKNREALR